MLFFFDLTNNLEGFARLFQLVHFGAGEHTVRTWDDDVMDTMHEWSVQDPDYPLQSTPALDALREEVRGGGPAFVVVAPNEPNIPGVANVPHGPNEPNGVNRRQQRLMRRRQIHEDFHGDFLHRAARRD